MCNFQPDSTGEQKTKPTQNSVRELRGLGLSPDLVSQFSILFIFILTALLRVINIMVNPKGWCERDTRAHIMRGTTREIKQRTRTTTNMGLAGFPVSRFYSSLA